MLEALRKRLPGPVRTGNARRPGGVAPVEVVCGRAYHFRMRASSLVISLLLCGATAAPQPAQLTDAIRNRIEVAGVPARISVGPELIHCSVELPRFYQQRGFRPVWTDEDGPSPLMEQLVAALRSAAAQDIQVQVEA